MSIPLSEILDYLRPIEYYNELCDVIEQDMEDVIEDLVTCEPNQREKLVGKLAAYRSILERMGR